MIRLLAILVLFISLVAAAVLWSGGTDGRGGRADFAFINRADNKTLDPNRMSWMQDIRLAYALWEGLYTLDPVTLQPILGCADQAKVDPQTHTVWTFHIRTDARWSNNDRVKAGDFIFAWRRFLETPQDYTYLHFYIRGAQEYADAFTKYADARRNNQSATPPDFSIVQEKVIDDQTLRVTLTDPIPFFPALCAFTPFVPLHEKSMKDFANRDPVTGIVTYDERFTRPPFLVTNGPYYMAEWSFKRRIRLRASPYYWDHDHVQSKVIDQISSEDALAAFRSYERGDVDWLADVDQQLASLMLTGNHRDDLHVFTAFGTYFWTFNCLPTLPNGNPNPLADVRVRRALCMAVDKKPIVEQVGRLNQPIATTYIPPNVFPGYPAPPGLAYDLNEARRLLADAGYPDGKGFPHLSLLYDTQGGHGDVAQILHRQWLDNLGIDTGSEGVENKTFGDRLHHQKYDIARASWYGDYNDPTTFTDKYKSDSDNNDSKWANPQYDKLCQAAQKEIDPARRLALLAQAEGILLDEAPILPLYHYVNAYMFRDSVKGLPLSPSAMQMFKSIEVTR